MSRHREDPLEIRHDSAGPLFDAPANHRVGRTDPPTSARAARSVDLGKAQRLALAFVQRNPGATTKDLAASAMAAFGGQNGIEWWRQRIGRRLNELEKAGVAYRSGERDGCALWWPGPAREVTNCPG